MRTIAISRVLLVVSILAVAPGAFAQPQTQETERAKKLAARRYAGGVVSLPVSAFATGLRLCTRETPSGVAGYWRVPPNIAAAMDAQLQLHLRKSGIDKRLPFAAKLYLRQ